MLHKKILIWCKRKQKRSIKEETSANIQKEKYKMSSVNAAILITSTMNGLKIKGSDYQNGLINRLKQHGFYKRHILDLKVQLGSK